MDDGTNNGSVFGPAQNNYLRAQNNYGHLSQAKVFKPFFQQSPQVGRTNLLYIFSGISLKVCTNSKGATCLTNDFWSSDHGCKYACTNKITKFT